MSAKKNDILSLLGEQEKLAAKAARRAIIIQPGAIGDCILTLPLAEFMKTSLNLGSVVFLGRLDYAGIFIGRTCIDGVKSIESVELHRLFRSRAQFDLEDSDPLLTAFAPYSWIVTFLGEPGSDFEHNLIFTAHCTHSAEVITLDSKPTAAPATHISLYYIEQFASAHSPPLKLAPLNSEQPLVTATEMDKLKGTELFEAWAIDTTTEKAVVIAPGSGAESKCWPIENYIAIATKLAQNDFKVIFLLGPAELDRFTPAMVKQLGRIAPCVSNLSLTEVLQLLSVSAAFVGNDSGIAHLAGATSVKTIAIFGPTQSRLYKPCGPSVFALQMSPEEFSAVSANRQQQIAELISQL
jgi:heptosyltransferase-3